MSTEHSKLTAALLPEVKPLKTDGTLAEQVSAVITYLGDENQKLQKQNEKLRANAEARIQIIGKCIGLENDI
jgi:hypothetical protein